jgi:hypothetical protein
MMVGFDNRLVAGQVLAKANVALTGRNGALPDTYGGLTVEDLARLMSLWRERAVGRR